MSWYINLLDRRKMLKTDKKIAIIFIGSLILLLYAGSRLWTVFSEYEKADKIYEDIKKEVLTKDRTPDPGDARPGEKEKNKRQADKIDFEQLIAINPEVIAWISIPEVDIDYPVTQTDNNEYYLHHAYNKEKSFAGSVFADYHNSSEFSDQNMILYGHNMRNKSMFGSLKDISENNEVIIYTPKSVLEYQVLKKQIIDVAQKEYYQISFNETNYFSFLKDAFSNTKIIPMENERVLTLSTCSATSRERLVVQCRLKTERSVDVCYQ